MFNILSSCLKRIDLSDKRSQKFLSSLDGGGREIPISQMKEIGAKDHQDAFKVEYFAD